MPCPASAAGLPTGFGIFVLVTQMLPATLIVVPLYVIFRQLGLYNTLTGLIIADTAFTLPLATWLMRGFFDRIPVDLEQQAEIDGCTRLGAFYRVTLPLSVPGIVVVTVFAFISAWDEFFLARDADLLAGQLGALGGPDLVRGAILDCLGRDDGNLRHLRSAGGCVLPVHPALPGRRYDQRGAKGMTANPRLRCLTCTALFPAVEHYACPECGGELDVTYDLGRIRAEGSFAQSWAHPGPIARRFAALLPLAHPGHAITLGEGQTPLIRSTRLGARLGLRQLYFKLEGSNPTGSFKDRQMAIGLSKAREWGAGRFATVSSGNVGVALSRLCRARRGRGAGVGLA